MLNPESPPWNGTASVTKLRDSIQQCYHPRCGQYSFLQCVFPLEILLSPLRVSKRFQEGQELKKKTSVLTKWWQAWGEGNEQREGMVSGENVFSIPFCGLAVPTPFHTNPLESWGGHHCSPNPSDCGKLKDWLFTFLQNLGQERYLPGEVGFPRQEVACEGTT